MRNRPVSPPPRLTEGLLKHIFPDSGDLTTLGDLEEVYHSIGEEQGALRARLWYRAQALKSILSFIKIRILWSTVMFKNYMVFTSRLIKRDKFHYFLNFLGLASGLACGIIIVLFLRNELTYDKYHENADRIYRISSTYVTSGDPIRFAISSPALGPRLKEEYPEIEEFVRISPNPDVLFEFGDSRFYERDIVYADPSIFKVFTYPLIQGDSETCLNDPNSMVMTEELAHKYFGDENPLGKIIRLENQVEFKVTGVIENPPLNAHIPIRGIVSFSTWELETKGQDWPIYEIFGYTYVLLPRGYQLSTFFEKFPSFYEKYIKKDEAAYNQVFEPVFLKLPEIHYNTVGFRAEMSLGSRSYLYAFFFIGIFILILASINYINMTTARSATRAKEIGMKKVLGSRKKDLIGQLMGESLLVTFLALVFAYGGVLLLLSATRFNTALELSLESWMLFDPVLIVGLLCLCALIGLLSGIYPAFYLSSIAPTQAIYGTFSTSRAGVWTRRALVTFQFVLSIGVVILTLFMGRQIEFMRNKDLGFKQENVVAVRLRDRDILTKIPAFKEELLQNPDVISVATGIGRPGSPSGGLYKFEGQDGMEEHNFAVFFAGFGYLETMGLEIVDGRDFDQSFTSDPGQAVIVNETLARSMGWEKPVGKRIQQFTFFDGQVVGVVRDFHFDSLHNRIEPILIRMLQQPRGSLYVRLKGENLIQTMGFLEEKWEKLNPNRPFIYSFMDEAFDHQYNADLRQNRLVRVFSVMSILISCLGLLGLSSFTALRRTKEVAIRKVLGASAARIVMILFREVFILIVLAVVVAVPVSLLFIDMWLGNFAYQTGISPLLFVAAGLGAVLVAFITASFHSFRVARADPTDNLRYE